jgi:hypothetical protein
MTTPHEKPCEVRDMTIKEVTMFETPDGVKHSSMTFAEQHEANHALEEHLRKRMWNGIDAQEVINLLTDKPTMKLVRDLFNKIDALEKEVMS